MLKSETGKNYAKLTRKNEQHSYLNGGVDYLKLPVTKVTNLSLHVFLLWKLLVEQRHAGKMQCITYWVL